MLRMTQLEFKSGDLKEFYCQFRSIKEDPKIEDKDKFQHVHLNYTPTLENYSKTVKT